MYNKEIKTLDGVRVILLDDPDYESLRIHDYSFSIEYVGNTPYVQLWFGADDVMLHYMIGLRNMRGSGIIPEGEAFYHINGDTFDNRSENIGLKKVKMKGATWDKRARKWRSQIWLQGKVKHLGHFRTPEEAHLAYLVALHENLDQRIYKPGV